MSRYELPGPTCRHARRGLVSAGDPHGAFASTQVCDRAECIADALEWAQAEVRQPATHRPDERPRPEPAQPTLWEVQL